MGVYETAADLAEMSCALITLDLGAVRPAARVELEISSQKPLIRILFGLPQLIVVAGIDIDTDRDASYCITEVRFAAKRQ